MEQGWVCAFCGPRSPYSLLGRRDAGSARSPACARSTAMPAVALTDTKQSLRCALEFFRHNISSAGCSAHNSAARSR